MPAYHIDSSLTEKQIEADVASYLGWCSKDLPFRLLDVNEQETGADKLSDITVPIYIQFKKSHGLKPLHLVGIKSRKNESPLQSIRRFRSRHGLADNPSLYFQLRAKADGATDFQHNILYAHHRPQKSYAVYVAPLILDLKKYYNELCEGPRYLDDPWAWREGRLLTSWGPGVWLSRYGLQPFLRRHISIAPHQKVTTHNHYYAFSESGDEVSWHSPERKRCFPRTLTKLDWAFRKMPLRH